MKPGIGWKNSIGHQPFETKNNLPLPHTWWNRIFSDPRNRYNEKDKKMSTIARAVSTKVIPLLHYVETDPPETFMQTVQEFVDNPKNISVLEDIKQYCIIRLEQMGRDTVYDSELDMVFSVADVNAYHETLAKVSDDEILDPPRKITNIEYVGMIVELLGVLVTAGSEPFIDCTFHESVDNETTVNIIINSIKSIQKKIIIRQRNPVNETIKQIHKKIIAKAIEFDKVPPTLDYVELYVRGNPIIFSGDKNMTENFVSQIVERLPNSFTDLTDDEKHDYYGKILNEMAMKSEFLQTLDKTQQNELDKKLRTFIDKTHFYDDETFRRDIIYQIRNYFMDQGDIMRFLLKKKEEKKEKKQKTAAGIEYKKGFKNDDNEKIGGNPTKRKTNKKRGTKKRGTKKRGTKKRGTKKRGYY
jgi:hypothetical protein